MADARARDVAGTVAVIGAGAMGRGIAQVAAVAGCRVLLTDARPAVVDEAVASVRARIERLVEKREIPASAGAAARESVVGVPNDPAALREAEVVVEAVVEDLGVKQRLFADLEAALGPAVVLATNTSSLSVTEIAAALAHPERLCGLHFFNPVPLMRLVEVIPGERTAPAVTDRLTALARAVGHTPVVVRDSPGFLVNHAGRAYATEALRLLDEGIAAPAALDRILRDAAGFRMGPFELFDLTGLDVSQPVIEAVYTGFYHDPRLRPSPTGRRRLAAGRLGRKTGRGFYEYVDGSPVVPPEPAAPPYDGTPVWVGGASGLADLLAGTGVEVERGARPSAGAVALVAPWGSDVSAVAAEGHLPAERTVGMDPFGGFAGRLTLASCPATAPEALAAAHGALAATGRPVTRIRDSTGFVAQRVVACVVNLGCEIAQLSLAAPADVDTAVRLGLGYPRGPLAWGDAIGAGTVLRVLEGLSGSYGDPRYRPSVWLRRRARLGLSLLTQEAA